MNVRGIFTAEDLIAANLIHMRPRKAYAVVGSILLVLAFAASVAGFVKTSAQDEWWSKWVGPGLLTYLALLFFMWMPYRARRHFRQRKDLQRECSFIPSDEGLEYTGPDGHSKKPWSDYLKWKEGRTHFLLYLADSYYQMVPKRFFTEPQQVDIFRSLLESKVRRREA